MPISTIPTSGLSSDQGVNFRNLIINGDMSIAQRGTSVSSISGGGAFDTVDRFSRYISNAGTWTISQSTDTPTGQGFANSTKLDCTTANSSLASGSEFIFRTKLEGQMLQMLKKGTSSAESTTLSFWVKSNKTGTYICELFDHDNSRHINKSYTISSANTWEKKTITFAGDTTGTLGNDNAVSIQCTWYLAVGTNMSSGTLQTSWGARTDANRAVGQVNLADSTSNEWYITGVQLEVGTTASDFEFLPFDVNLKRCQRYFLRTYRNASGDYHCYPAKGQGTDAARFNFYLNVPMRATPSISQSGNWRLFGDSGMVGNTNNVPSVLYYDVLGTALALEVDGYSGLTDNEVYNIAVQNMTYFDIDSEL